MSAIHHYRLLYSVLFFSLITALNLAQAESINDKHFKTLGVYSGINWLQKKPHLLSKNKIVLVIDKKKDKSFTLDAIDISDISKPKHLKTLINNGYTIRDFSVTDDEQTLFVSMGGRLHIYDISDFTNIILKEKIRLYYAGTLTLSANNTLLYASGCVTKKSLCSTMTVFKLTPYPVVLAELETNGGYKHTLSKDGTKLAFFSSGEQSKTSVSGVTLVQISPSFEVTQLDFDSKPYNNRGSWKHSANIRELAFSGNGETLYVAGGVAGVIVYDVSDNTLDKIQQTAGRHWGALFNNTKSVYSLDVIGDSLYLAGSRLNGKVKTTNPFIRGIDKAFYFSSVIIKASLENIIMVYDNIYDTNSNRSSSLIFMQPIK